MERRLRTSSSRRTMAALPRPGNAIVIPPASRGHSRAQRRLALAHALDDVPVLVVEARSPSTAAEDTVRKSVEYLQAGIAHYWLVDRTNRVLIAFGNAGDGWEVALRLDVDPPIGAVDIAGHGTVRLDLPALLDG
ncbi:Uma2 family endonuclease [Nocardioides sp. W3-2-3]|nr:Uma2 family endonuclease [Nocardioides convexus]